MENYTWGQFWTVVVLLTLIYYGVIYLIFYLPKKKRPKDSTLNINDSNNIDKSDNNITIFDSPFISNFDLEDNTSKSDTVSIKQVPTSDSILNATDSEEPMEDEFEMIGFDEEDVIFDNGLHDDDISIMEDSEDLVELEEDMFEVTWESYTPGEQINFDFDK